MELLVLRNCWSHACLVSSRLLAGCLAGWLVSAVLLVVLVAFVLCRVVRCLSWRVAAALLRAHFIAGLSGLVSIAVAIVE